MSLSGVTMLSPIVTPENSALLGSFMTDNEHWEQQLSHQLKPQSTQRYPFKGIFF